MSTKRSCLDAALSYAKIFGWAVIPVHWPTEPPAPGAPRSCSCGKADCKSVGKHPLTKHGARDATRDETKIRAWWAQSPEANVGIVTGAISGIWALDIDPRHEGDETVRGLEAKHGSLGPTILEAITGSKGKHLFFSIPSNRTVLSRTNVAKGIDVRGEGGFVVAAPSLHACGRYYEWEIDHRPDALRPGPAPAWVLDLASGQGAFSTVSLPASSAQKISEDPRVKSLIEAVAPQWPPVASNRHELALAFGGWCAKNGVPFAVVDAVLRGVAVARGDDDVRDRIEAARASFKRHNEGGVVAGATRLPPELLKNLKTAWRAERQREDRNTGVGPAGADAATDEGPPPPEEKFESFPIDALPEPVRRYVREAATAIGCCLSYVALPLLAALAAAVGNTRRIRLKNSWTEPAVLWSATIGESGTLKTPPFDAALAALRRRQDAEFAKYKEKLKTHEDDKARYDADIKAWRAKKPPRGDPPTKPEKPFPPRILVSDPTVEALAVILQNAPRGVLLARDELSGWIGGFDQYKAKSKGSDAPHYLEMFRAGPVTVDRKGEPSTVHVPRAAVSVCGTIQPAVIVRVLGKEHFEDGFAARLLLTWPPPKRKRWTDEDVTRIAQDAINLLFDKLFSLDFALSQEGVPEPFTVKMTATARAEFVAFYNEHAGELADMEGDEAALWSKLEGYVPRFALIFFLIRQVWGEAKGDEVEDVDIRNAITLARWFGNEGRRIYAALKEEPEERDRRRLIEIIQRHDGQMTANDLRRCVRRFRKYGAKAALDDLVAAKLGTWVKVEGQKGRPCDLFVLGVYESTNIPPAAPPDSPRETPPETESAEFRRFVDTSGAAGANTDATAPSATPPAPDSSPGSRTGQERPESPGSASTPGSPSRDQGEV
ncbi:MAG: DUF3987 domain-containing protein [Candidatus Brocadiae bacterium]|nr:DUF3987 domain-containing protein [Candidatus Brocadiia bacterium]